VPWPEFVINDPVEVLAVNRAAEALWRIDFAHERGVRTRAQMNLLSVAGERHTRDPRTTARRHQARGRGGHAGKRG
jgi:hypothetical protein